MLKALLKVQLQGFLSAFTGASRSKKKRSPLALVGFSALMLYAVCAVAFLIAMLFSELKEPFSLLGLDWLYFTMAAIVGFGIMFIGSVFTAKAQLFEAKDNERLLAMPIPPQTILLSRMVVLYLTNLALGVLAMVPAFLVWGPAHLPTAGIAAFVLELLLLPLLSMAVSGLFAWVITAITSLFPKKSNLVSVILYMAFFTVYMVFCARMQSYITILAGMGETLAKNLGAVAPLYWLGAAVTGEVPAIFGMVLTCVAPFAVLYYLLSRDLIRLLTTHRSQKKTVYKQEELEVTAPQKALLAREFKHLSSNVTWMLNGGLGPVFLLVGAVVLLAAVAMLVGLAPFSNCAVSLEYKSYWILRTMPVASQDILNAKLQMTELLNVPAAALFCVAAAFCFRIEMATALILLLAAVWFTRLIVKIGLAEDLRHGKLDWANEALAVKQSVAVLATMAISFGITAALVLLWFLVFSKHLGAMRFLTAALVVFVLADRLLGSWLKTSGAKRYEEFH